MKNLSIILAAGKGTRMKSELPKCLHEVAGAPMVEHVLRTSIAAGSDAQVVVVGHKGDLIKTALDAKYDDMHYVEQTEQLGTGHAVQIAKNLIADCEGIVTVLYGDSPLFREESIRALVSHAEKINGPVVLGFKAQDAGKYGRLITSEESLTAIREAKDASADELAIDLCNSGVLACPAELLNQCLSKLTNDNAAGEYYLTDVIEIARSTGANAGFILCDERETQGVNTPEQLVDVARAYQTVRRSEAMAQGAKMLAPETVYFYYDTEIGTDVVIEPNVVFMGGVTVENDAQINAFSHIEGAHIGEGAIVGPYARLRPGSEIGANAKVGNFVETKNAILAHGAKVNHLSYIGDAEIGEDSNIGAGTITCNYDGVFKHKTKIGKRVFIGSNASLVAPLNIGDDAMTGSGSVITDDVPTEDLAIGRARQSNKTGLGKKFMARLKAIKAKG